MSLEDNSSIIQTPQTFVLKNNRTQTYLSEFHQFGKDAQVWTTDNVNNAKIFFTASMVTSFVERLANVGIDCFSVVKYSHVFDEGDMPDIEYND